MKKILTFTLISLLLFLPLVRAGWWEDFWNLFGVKLAIADYTVELGGSCVENKDCIGYPDNICNGVWTMCCPDDVYVPSDSTYSESYDLCTAGEGTTTTTTTTGGESCTVYYDGTYKDCVCSSGDIVCGDECVNGQWVDDIQRIQCTDSGYECQVASGDFSVNGELYPQGTPGRYYVRDVRCGSEATTTTVTQTTTTTTIISGEPYIDEVKAEPNSFTTPQDVDVYCKANSAGSDKTLHLDVRLKNPSGTEIFDSGIIGNGILEVWYSSIPKEKFSSYGTYKAVCNLRETIVWSFDPLLDSKEVSIDYSEEGVTTTTTTTIPDGTTTTTLEGCWIEGKQVTTFDCDEVLILPCVIGQTVEFDCSVCCSGRAKCEETGGAFCTVGVTTTTISVGTTTTTIGPGDVTCVDNGNKLLNVECCPEGYATPTICSDDKCCGYPSNKCVGSYFSRKCGSYTDLGKIVIDEIWWTKDGTQLSDQYKVQIGDTVGLHLKLHSEITQTVEIKLEIKESDPVAITDEVVNVISLGETTLSTTPTVFDEEFKVPSIPDGWFGLLGDADLYFHPLFNGEERCVDGTTGTGSFCGAHGGGKDNSRILKVRKGEGGLAKGIELIDWGFYIGEQKVWQVPEGADVNVKVTMKAISPVSGRLKLILRSDTWMWYDAVKGIEEENIDLTTDDVYVITLAFRPSQDSVLHTETYHINVELDGEDLFGRLPSSRTEDIKVIVGQVLVQEYGWYSGGSKVTEVGSGETVNAVAIFNNIGEAQSSGVGKIKIRQDVKWAGDKDVKQCQQPAQIPSGGNYELVCPFVGEDGTAYHFEVFWNEDKLVERSNSVCTGGGLFGCKDPLDWIIDFIFGRNWLYIIIFIIFAIGGIFLLFFILPFLLQIMLMMKELRE